MPEIIVKLGDSIVQKNVFVKEAIHIGRVSDNEIVVENLAVSRYHAVIDFEEGRYILTDLDSANGTFVNGVRIKKTELQDRDVITIGKHKLYFYDQQSAGEIKPRASVVEIERSMLREQQGLPTQAELEIVKGRQKGTRFVINGNSTSIGRGAFNEIQLSDWFVSKMHAVVERRGNEFVIRDLGSWRHTYVNGILVHELPLTDGDTIQMGPTVQLTFNLVRPDQPLPATARVPVELAPGSSMAASKAVRTRELGGTPTEQEIIPADRPDNPYQTLKWEPAMAPVDIATELNTAAESELGAEDELEQVNGTAHAPVDAAEDQQGEMLRALQQALGMDQSAELAPGEPDEATELAESDEATELAESDEATEPADPFEWGKPIEPIEPATPKTLSPWGLDDMLDQYVTPAPPQPEPEPAPAAEAEPTAAATEHEVDLDELDEMLLVNHPMASLSPVEDQICYAANEAPEAAETPAEATPAPEPSNTAKVDLTREEETQMWERALKNKNPLIRKQAARQLQKLTGRDYDYT